MSVSSFEVFQAMSAANDQRLMAAPLGNIISARKVRAGTQVTIGVGGDVVGAIAQGRLVGGLILVDRDAFKEVEECLNSPEERAKARLRDAALAMLKALEYCASEPCVWGEEDGPCSVAAPDGVPCSSCCARAALVAADPEMRR